MESTLSPDKVGIEESPLRAGSDSEAYGIVAFSHLRWNFVWQRPQQFLSRFAERHKVLFIEEPDFSLTEGEAPKLVLVQAAPSITVATMKFPPSLRGDASVSPQMRQFAQQA